MWVLLALGVLANASRVLSSGYCSQNTFPTNTSWMHFTKEPVPFEYGFQDKFKSIHCCVKGYRSIEWFKDGVAYPWSAGVSNLILYPEAANQTLYTRRATRADSGNYTCRLSNETQSETHTVRLEILEKATDAPKTMFISKDQWVEEGSAVRLFCEALIASSYLADARSDLRWWKVFPNGTDGELLPSQNEIRTKREDVEDIIGSYLSIERVSAADYGTYACVVHSNDVVSRSYVTVHYKHGGVGGWEESGGVPWRALAACGASVVLAGVLLAAAHRRYTPRLLLAARHARARAAGAAQRARVLEKEFDVLVCSTAVDSELVRGALLPTLALKYKYRVLARTLSNNPDNWYKEIVCEVGRCRSVVGVVSPAQHTPAQLLTALRQLRALPLPPVVVLLQVNIATGYKEIVCEVGRCRSVVGVVSPAQHTPAQLLTALRQLRALPLPPVVVLLQVNIATGYKEIVCEVGRCRSVVGVVSPAQHTPAQLLTALRQLRALPLPPVVVLLQVNIATGYKEIVCEVGRCRSVVGVVSPAQHTPAQLLTALRQLRALPLPPVVVLLQVNIATGYKEIVCEVGRCRSVVGVVSPAQHTPAQLLTALRQLRALPLPPVVVLLQVNIATGYKEIVCEVGRCRSVVGVVSPAQHTPAQLLTALRQLRALPLPPVVVLLQDLPKLKREAKESGESLVSVLRRTRLVAWRHVHERAFWTALRLALPLPPPPQPAREEKTEVEETRNPNSGSMTALV